MIDALVPLRLSSSIRVSFLWIRNARQCQSQQLPSSSSIAPVCVFPRTGSQSAGSRGGRQLKQQAADVARCREVSRTCLSGVGREKERPQQLGTRMPLTAQIICSSTRMPFQSSRQVSDRLIINNEMRHTQLMVGPRAKSSPFRERRLE